ncbi:MAG: glutamate--tRNA ligase [Sphaerimonospora mesophila]
MIVRTRFAPSPTGFLHVGGIRTALFAFLVARQAGGQFVLRFEDTDKKREVSGSAEHLIASLQAIDIEYNEGPDIGGPYAPYIQSQRLDHYRAWAQKLIDMGRAYADPYTPEQLQTFRDEAMAAKRAFRYRDHRPENPPIWDGTQPLRFKSEPTSYTYHDEVMGDITTSPEVVDDFILIKSDGYPTYNFAHIIDDAEMAITHVIRGQEFISSMPNYLALYEALGLERPIFAHLPHIMNEQGNKKLGKRDGAKDVLDYIRDGYLPETMMSFIASLGWNDGTEQEVFTKQELIEKFSLTRVQRSGARFDEKRLLWMNGQFIRELSLDELSSRAEAFWPRSAAGTPESYKKQVLALAQDRLKTLGDLSGLTRYFFEEPTPNPELITDNKQLKKLAAEEAKQLIEAATQALADLTDWTADSIQACLNQLLETTGQKPGILFSLVRIATTWAPFSPQLDSTLALLGRKRTLQRLADFDL